ncbi:MAG TPA: type II toxin-antitoxin system ParD family antitoxin, partial [Tepidisphaeraceae bacterium]|nr:type II toxin-antitoxin system ParD family antitoxin [Tepidisphaeraceae bacterium]
MNLALKPDLQRFVETQLNTGRFRSAEEVVQAGLELLRDRQQQLDHVREQLSEGLEQARRGELIDGEE